MDASQWAGVLAFGVAAAVCLITGARPWPLLGLGNACFALECALGWRHGLNSSLPDMFRNLYSNVSLVQLLSMVGLIGIAAVTLAQMRGRAETSGNSGAATATLVAALLFLVETAAPTGIEALLYWPVQGLLVIGWLWLLLGGTTVVAALLAARRTGVSRR